MSTSDSRIKDPELERQGAKLTGTGNRWLLAGLIACGPGIVLFVVGLVVGLSWMWAIGLAVILLGGGPAVAGFALLGSGAVSRWSARHKSFA